MHGKGFALRFLLMRTTKIRQQPNAWHTFFVVHFFIVRMTKKILCRASSIEHGKRNKRMTRMRADGGVCHALNPMHDKGFF
jgi:hypothetical protein